MLDAVMRAAGVSAETGRSLERIMCEAEPMLRALALEYGRAPCEIIPHDPRQTPFTQRGEIAANSQVLIDVEQKLGKPGTRGHVSNNGSGDLLIDWQTPSTGESWAGDYKLKPNAVLDLSSFVVEKLLIRTEDDASEFQMLAQ